jgi:hypothetical protein
MLPSTPTFPLLECLPTPGLARAHRPGLGQEAPILVAAVEAWVKGARTQGMRSVICLLGTEELKQ